MAFLRSVAGDVGPSIRGERIFLRQPHFGDFAQWSRLREESRAFLSPWEPTWPVDDLTRGAYRRRIRRYVQDMRDDLAYPFYAFRNEDEGRGVTQSCTLGYWAGERFARQGYMSEAVSLVLPFVFGQLRLHRLEAACLPTNQPSIGLLEKVGFTREGYARSYLRINGSWQDHFLFAMLHDDPRPVLR